jgi:hypothetical protein
MLQNLGFDREHLAWSYQDFVFLASQAKECNIVLHSVAHAITYKRMNLQTNIKNFLTMIILIDPTTEIMAITCESSSLTAARALFARRLIRPAY